MCICFFLFVYNIFFCLYVCIHIYKSHKNESRNESRNESLNESRNALCCFVPFNVSFPAVYGNICYVCADSFLISISIMSFTLSLHWMFPIRSWLFSVSRRARCLCRYFFTLEIIFVSFSIVLDLFVTIFLVQVRQDIFVDNIIILYSVFIILRVLSVVYICLLRSHLLIQHRHLLRFLRLYHLIELLLEEQLKIYLT